MHKHKLYRQLFLPTLFLALSPAFRIIPDTELVLSIHLLKEGITLQLAVYYLSDSFYKYLLRTFCVQSTVLGAEKE